MAKGRAQNAKASKKSKQQNARRARHEHQALESLAQKRRPFEPLLKQVVAAVLHAHAPAPGGSSSSSSVSVDEPPSGPPPVEWVEVGSGLGQLRALLPPDVRGRVTHTELSASLVRGLVEKHPDARAVVADVSRLPFDTQSVDAVLGLCVFDSFPDPAKACTEIARVLRDGGRFIHFLDAATNIEPVFVQLVRAGHLPLPNFFADIALRRPDLVDGRIAHLVQPYHDVLSVPLSQFLAITEMLKRAGHRLAAMFERYVAPFSQRPFDPLVAARAFVRLTSDPAVGRPLNQALMSLFTTLQQPPYSELVPFDLRAHSSLGYFKALLEHYFGPAFGFELQLSDIVYARAYEADEPDPMRARVRRVGIGQNSTHWPAPEGIPAQTLDPELPSPESAGATIETHVLREAAIYCLVSERKRNVAPPT